VPLWASPAVLAVASSACLQCLEGTVGRQNSSWEVALAWAWGLRHALHRVV